MWTIDTDFPGGNLVVESIVGDLLRVRQDWSTSKEWWFHWAFRIRGAAGRELRFVFTDGDVFHGGGPCLRVGDAPGGAGWRALGRESVIGNGFSHRFGPDENEATFAFAPLHTARDWAAFASTQPALARHHLTTSEGGREVAYHTLEPTVRHASSATPIVLLTARSHACESLASYLMEGVVAGWIHDADPAVAAARARVALWVLPFIDVDGVERGDQGKFRMPRDHNQDYCPGAIYHANRALMGLARAHADRLLVALDLHCPWIRVGRNESVFLAGPPSPHDAAFREFSRHLARRVTGPIPYDPADDVPHGVEWNHYRSHHGTRFMMENTSARLAATVEFPYGLARGVPVTPENARLFGAQFARALADSLNASV